VGKISIFIGLFILFVIYSFAVYTKGTNCKIKYSETEQQQISNGKEIFQAYNCIACHQLYGLGGYLGTDLTTAWSDKHRGPAYMKAFLMAGGSRMPKYDFKEEEINALIRYLEYVDSTAITYKVHNR
jgi:nitric oxide reductase subunit C